MQHREFDSTMRGVPFFTRLFNSRARDLDRRIRVFRTEVLAVRASFDEAALDGLRRRAAVLGLDEDDVAVELEIVEGLSEVAALRKAATAGLPLEEIQTSHRALAGEACRFVAPAFRPDVAGDSGGKLFFTDRRLVYLGSPSVAVSWAHITDVRDEDRDLLVRVRPDGLRTFRCNSYVDTLRGQYLASRLLAAVHHRT